MSLPFVPEPGDVIWTIFDPRVGREQSGRRPALVVSPSDFFVSTLFLIVCPITTRIRPFPSSVVLPPGLPVEGEVLISAVRAIDSQARPIASAGFRVSPEVAAEVREKLRALITI